MKISHQLKNNFNKLLSLTFAATLSISLIACSEEDRNALSTLSDLADSVEDMENATPSTFPERCIEPIDGILEDNGEDRPTLSNANRQLAIEYFNVCLSELDKEHELTLEEFPDIDNLPTCKETLGALVEFSDEFEQKISTFKNLPINNQEDQTNAAMQFSVLALEMMARGGGMAVNRISICNVERASPEFLEQQKNQ